MKRVNIGLLVIGSFVLFHYILPEITFRMGIDSRFSYALLRFLSLVSIPVVMFFSIDFNDSVKRVSISLFLVAFGFFLIEASSSNPNGVYSFFLGIFFMIIMFSSLYLFVVGLTLEPTYYFKRQVGIFLVITSLLLILKYSGIMNIGYFLIYDYIKTGGVGWNITRILNTSDELIFTLYFAFQYLALDGIIVERNKYV